MLLNLEGKRFVDETVGDHLTTLALVEQPESRALIVSDARVRLEWILRPYVEGVHPQDTFDNAYRRGARAAIAESIDELAYLPDEWGYDGRPCARRCWTSTAPASRAASIRLGASTQRRSTGRRST